MQKYTILRTTEEEKTQLKKDAYRHELNISEYLRWLVEKERKDVIKWRTGTRTIRKNTPTE